MTFLWSYGLILIAAFFNAIMDTLENEPAFNRSIFKDWTKEFWSKQVSWKYARKVFNYKVDGWHLAKSAMIFSLVGAIVVFRIHHAWWVHFISMGLIWNITFEGFYRLFKCK